jgi:hypothetical protein
LWTKRLNISARGGQEERKGKKMKTLGYMLIAALSLLMGLSSSALARPKVRLDINLGGRQDFYRGRPDFHRERRPDKRFDRRPRCFKPARGWRDYRPHRRTIILGSGCWYDRGPDYCVVTTPTVIRATLPVVVDRPVIVVKSQQFDESTLQLNLELQHKKNELLKQLQMPNKELRRQAIKELAGFSFDDNVRNALEQILLSDLDPELRAEAADAFGVVKNANAKPALEKARVEDPSADVRRAADEAIKSIEGN